MEYVFRFLFGFLVTFAGCEIAILIMRRRVTIYKHDLKFFQERLTKPESYIWVRVEDHPPERTGEYLVEYTFDDQPPSCPFYSVHAYSVIQERFEHDGFRGLKVHRWAELPK